MIVIMNRKEYEQLEEGIKHRCAKVVDKENIILISDLLKLKLQ